MRKLTKSEAEKEIEEFFKNLQEKTPEEIKKVRILAAKHNIKLGQLKKRFCKKCYSFFKNSEIRIRAGKKIVKCKNCGYVGRWKIGRKTSED